MRTDISEWREFKFGDLIDYIGKAKALNKDDLNETKDLSKGIRYITRTSENNGCELLANKNDIDEKYIQKGNAITIGDTTATCFYQKEEFITGDHMVVIRAGWLNELTGLFIVSLLNREMYKYSYGRAFVMDKIKETTLNLPATNEGKPDWQFMEDYIKTLHYELINTSNKPDSVNRLTVNGWKPFYLKDIFTIKMGNGFDKNKMSDQEPSVNFVSRTALNNGVDMKVDFVEGVEPYPSGLITIALGGSLGSCYLQSEPFYTAQNVAVLTAKYPQINDYVKLFISTVIKFECKIKYYPFGRELNSHIGKDFSICLPVTPDGTPDWQFMEDYIKSLPYGDRI